MTFRSDLPRRRGAQPTPAQAAATARNWKIRNLRALHALCWALTGQRRVMAQELIDQELMTMGALPTALHQAKRDLANAIAEATP